MQNSKDLVTGIIKGKDDEIVNEQPSVVKVFNFCKDLVQATEGMEIHEVERYNVITLAACQLLNA